MSRGSLRQKIPSAQHTHFLWKKNSLCPGFLPKIPLAASKSTTNTNAHPTTTSPIIRSTPILKPTTPTPPTIYNPSIAITIVPDEASQVSITPSNLYHLSLDNIFLTSASRIPAKFGKFVVMVQLLFTSPLLGSSGNTIQIKKNYSHSKLPWVHLLHQLLQGFEQATTGTFGCPFGLKDMKSRDFILRVADLPLSSMHSWFMSLVPAFRPSPSPKACTA